MKVVFLCVVDNWNHGWFSTPEAINKAIVILRKNTIFSLIERVRNEEELHRALHSYKKDTLIWPNSYSIGPPNSRKCLVKILESYNLPVVGSPSDSLNEIINKDLCQKQLELHNIPIPKYQIMIATHNNHKNTDLDFPVVIKPTSASQSEGVKLVYNDTEMREHIAHIKQALNYERVIVESYVLSPDITCGYFQLNDNYMLLPTLQTFVSEKPNERNISTYQKRLSDWGAHKCQQILMDKESIRQICLYIPQIINALNIIGATRIDCRRDSEGQLRFFDVNGMPGLSVPQSDLIEQCRICFPGYSFNEIVERLFNTIVLNAAIENNISHPNIILEKTLFSLESKFVYKGCFNDSTTSVAL